MTSLRFVKPRVSLTVSQMTLYLITVHDYSLLYSARTVSRNLPYDAQYQKKPSLQDILNFEAELKIPKRIGKPNQKSEIVEEEDGPLDERLIGETGNMTLTN